MELCSCEAHERGHFCCLGVRHGRVHWPSIALPRLAQKKHTGEIYLSICWVNAGNVISSHTSIIMRFSIGTTFGATLKVKSASVLIIDVFVLASGDGRTSKSI